MEKSKTTFKNRAKLLAALCILALLSLGGTMAYMTDHESAENRFTVGKVDFNLYERNWDGERPDGTYATSSNATSSNATSSNALGMEQAENMYAGMEINKDPAIKNNSKNDAYLRMTVKVPVATVSTADRDGNLVDGGIQKETELFSYELNPYCGMKPVSYWPTVENGFHVYEYMYTGDGYHEIPVPAGHNIPPLFHTVTFANVVDGEINEETEFIYVDFKAIQSGGFDTPEDAWRAYDNQSQ